MLGAFPHEIDARRRDRRPAVLVTAGYALLFAVTLLLPGSLHTHDGFRLALHVVLSLYVVLALTRLGWWRRTGFRRPMRLRSLFLLWLPLLPTLLGLTRPLAPAAVTTVLVDAAVMLMIGFHEEAIFRGVLLHGSRFLGALRAVLVTATVFGLFHFNNILTGQQDVGTTIVQVVMATMTGIVYGAVRVRTATIWPLVLIHGLHNFLNTLAAPTGEGATVSFIEQLLGTVVPLLPLVAVALFWLRRSRTASWPVDEEPVEQEPAGR